MDTVELQKKMYIKDPALSITRLNYDGEVSDLGGGCTLRGALGNALRGETVHLTAQSSPCRGGATGFGFTDGIPDIPGGFGSFISQGAGKGFPAGEKIKCNPAIAEAMLLGQPQKVMEGFDTIRIKPFEPEDDADIVTLLVGPDSLSALIHLFNFRDSSFDNVIAPMTSGCSSIFRIPFGEMLRDSNRAVIGNVDIVSRMHFDEESFFFTVSGERFRQMLDDADDCILSAPYWRGIDRRLARKESAKA